MSEEESILDKDLDKIVSSSDPITVVLELNEEMMWRVGRIGYVLSYAFWAGIMVTILATLFMIYTLLTEVIYINLIGSFLVAFFSIMASVYAYREKPFLDEYKVLAGSVSRAKDWQPNPRIPDGKTMLDRYLNYLSQTDDRFAFYFNHKPKYLHRDFRMEKKKEGKEIQFDAVLAGSSFPWDKVVEDVRVLIRVVPLATLSELRTMKDDAEYALRHLRDYRFVSKPGPARIILVQAQNSEFDHEVVKTANTEWVKYERGLGGTNVSWSSPIELVAEKPSGDYEFGTIFFG